MDGNERVAISDADLRGNLNRFRPRKWRPEEGSDGLMAEDNHTLRIQTQQNQSRWHGKDYHWTLDSNRDSQPSAPTRGELKGGYQNGGSPNNNNSPQDVLASVASLRDRSGWAGGACCTASELAAANAAPLPASSPDWVSAIPALTKDRQGAAAGAECHFLLPKTSLLFNPPDIEGQLQPCLHTDLWHAPSNLKVGAPVAPTFSIILNVFNHGFSIARVITQVLKLTTEPFELIVFFDGCTDDSIAAGLAVVERFVSTEGWQPCTNQVDVGGMSAESSVGEECTHVRNTPAQDSGANGENVQQGMRKHSDSAGGQLVHFRAIVQAANNSVYETTGNNIAMRAAAGKFLVLMQDDMYLLQRGWNTHLAAGPRSHDDVVSVSAMCAHDLYDHRGNPNHKTGPCGARRLMMRPALAEAARAAEQPAAVAGGAAASAAGTPVKELTMNLRQTSNRGPLLLVAEKVRQLRFLDEYNYRLAKDDHDFHCRAFLENQWYTGHIGIGFVVNLAEGGVRLGRKAARPQYDLVFTKRRNGRTNRRDCLVSRRAEYDAKVNATGGAIIESRRVQLPYG